MDDTRVASMMRPAANGIERRAIAWWMLRSLLSWGLILVVLVVIGLLWSSAWPWLLAPIIGASVLVLVLLFVAPWWRFRVHRWEITDRATYATTGWVVQEWRVAPTSRIQTVDAVRGPLEQFLGLSTLRVTTASSAGAINIVGLDRRTAERAASQLAAVAELSEGDAT
ncbi:PH domain-containing protein [Cumulibacter soli]|uniref:PH domain-containing protein n=1 Tax=Cumulibacter soli TaxID=2546344 RepID=UPI001ABAE7FC|nr:PH domain-containing protein [Cumulibacter soli]